MGNCHDCKSFLSKTELALGFPETTEESYIVSDSAKNYSHFLKVLPKLIGAWRGHTERKQFMHIYKQSKPEYSYFDINEVKETLSTSIGLARFKEKRSEYKFKKGKYTGEWCGGFRHGFGIMEWKDGSKYEGHWAYSRPSGSGKFIYKNGEGYQGDWKVYYIFSKAIFKTGRLEQWKDCVQDGYCKGYLVWLWITFHLNQAENEVFDSKSQVMIRQEVQVKEFRIMKDAAVKQNLVEIADGKYSYIGPAKNGKKAGFGKMTWVEGKYEGQFVNDMQHGIGSIEWDDGNKYFGGFFKDMREGVGEFQWKLGNKYIGEWKSNFMNGFGIYLWKDGKEYTGNWKNGERDGYGIMKYTENKLYEGQFKHDKPNGIGVLKTDTEEFRGKWLNGKLVKE